MSKRGAPPCFLSVKISYPVRTFMFITALFAASACAPTAARRNQRLVQIDRADGVEAVYLRPGGKGLFIVRPAISDRDCRLYVQRTSDVIRVDCNTHYLIACDAAQMPFCRLVEEADSPRESFTPQEAK
jgi:hypothetical protein